MAKNLGLLNYRLEVNDSCSYRTSNPLARPNGLVHSEMKNHLFKGRAPNIHRLNAVKKGKQASDKEEVNAQSPTVNSAVNDRKQ